MRTTGHAQENRSASGHVIVVPAALSNGLPRFTAWEIEATSTGYSLTFLGEREKKQNRAAERVELPFLGRVEQ